jgi:hypothetical protein
MQTDGRCRSASAADREESGVSDKKAAKKAAKNAAKNAVRRATRDVQLAARDALQESRRDASIVTEALQDLLTSAETSSSATLDALAATSDRISGRLNTTIAQVEQHRIAIEHVRAAVEDYGRESMAQFDRIAAGHAAQIERASVETGARIQTLEQEVAARVAASLAATERDAQQLRDDARLRIDDAIRDVDAQSRAALHRTTERLGALVAQAEADFAAQQEQRDVHAAESARDVADEESVDAEPPLAWTPASDVPVEDLSPALPGDPALLAVASTADTPGTDARETGARETDEPGTALADGAPASDDDLGEADLFDRLVAEFRLSPRGPDLSPIPAPSDSDVTPPAVFVESRFDEPPAAEPLPVSGEDGFCAPQRGILTTSSHKFGPSPTMQLEAVPTPVGVSAATVKAPVLAFLAGVDLLVRGGAEYVRVELVNTHTDDRSLCSILIYAHAQEGWWDCHEVAARTRTGTVEPLVVSATELHEALTAVERFDDVSEVELQFDGRLTIGNYLLVPGDPHAVPALPNGCRSVESIDLQSADRGALVLETQLGRLVAPPQLVAHLRAMRPTEVELMAAEGVPLLCALAPGAAKHARMRCFARLFEVGENGEPEMIERRAAVGGEATQLVTALSADTSPDELARILKIGVGYVRRRAAAHPSLPQDIILELMRSGTDAMRAAAASNVSLGPDACELAAIDPSPVVRAAVAANPAITERLLDRLAADQISHVRAHAAANPGIDHALLGHLAVDEDPIVRTTVAQRHDLATDLLLTLARDPDPMVCAAVAANTNCPPDLLVELAGYAASVVLANPSAPESLLVAGSTNTSPQLRAAVAANPKTPVKSLRKLAHDSDVDVLRAVMENSRTPSDSRRRVGRRLGHNDDG